MSTMTAALATFRELFAAHRAQATQSIHELVRRVVDGEQIAPAVLFDAARLAGMDGEQVDAMAERMRARDRARQVAAQAGGAEAELTRLQAAVAKHREQLEDAQRRYATAVEPLQLQIQDAQARLRDANAAAAELFDRRVMEPELFTRWEAAKAAVHQTATAVSTLEREIREQTARREDAAERMQAHGIKTAEIEQLWRDENTRHRVPPATETVFLHWLRGGIRTTEAQGQLPDARKAAKAAQDVLDAVELEIKTS